MKPHRPWLWNDVETPTGWHTPIGFVSKEAVDFFRRPYFKFSDERDGQVTMALVDPRRR